MQRLFLIDVAKWPKTSGSLQGVWHSVIPADLANPSCSYLRIHGNLWLERIRERQYWDSNEQINKCM